MKSFPEPCGRHSGASLLGRVVARSASCPALPRSVRNSSQAQGRGRHVPSDTLALTCAQHDFKLENSGFRRFLLACRPALASFASFHGRVVVGRGSSIEGECGGGARETHGGRPLRSVDVGRSALPASASGMASRAASASDRTPWSARPQSAARGRADGHVSPASGLTAPLRDARSVRFDGVAAGCDRGMRLLGDQHRALLRSSSERWGSQEAGAKTQSRLSGRLSCPPPLRFRVQCIDLTAKRPGRPLRDPFNHLCRAVP